VNGMALPREPPHRVVDSILNAIAEGLKSAGEGLQKAIDTGPLAEKGPHRGVDAIIDGAIGAVQGFAEGFMKALDKPLEAVK